MDNTVGEIRAFAGDYAPRGWEICNGKLLSVSEYPALFSLIGFTYGGDNRNLFALPDLRGRLVVQNGQLAGGSAFPFGRPAGQQSVTLTAGNMGEHQHDLVASTEPAVTSTAANNYLSKAQDPGNPGSDVLGYLPYKTTDTTLKVAPLNANTLTSAGNSAPHDNRQPYLPISYIIALNGVYPDFSSGQ
ncbi:MAG: tail fiber protein [Chitinophagaceae bacterium]